MNKGYKGGCFSLKVPPIFCRNGSLVLIPKGRVNEINVYETLGSGKSISKFSASKEVITGLGVFKSDHEEEFLVTTTFGGLVRIFSLEDVLSQRVEPLVEMRLDCQHVIDLKVAGSNIYILTGQMQKEHDTVLVPDVSLYKISGKDVCSRLGSGGRGVAESESWQKYLEKVVDFSYGALSFQVSQDESIFYFVWKNILLLWSTEYPDRIIRFRHSEYILSLTVSEDKQFVATGDAYGRLTYWFIPPSSTKEGIHMWKNAPSVSERLDFEKMVYKYNVKTSISHWHSHELTCLGMIPGTDVVLSGGEEAVLVLWRQTFSSDSYLIHTRNQFKNPNNNGTRQFIPRLGAPIYNISTFRKQRHLPSFSKETQSPDHARRVDGDLAIPSVLAAIVCSDNSIKILDLVHNRVLNSIYGVSTPFDMIKGLSADSQRMKMLGSQQLNPSRLLVSVVGHPFKLHVHDLIGDVLCSSILCKPEESYVSSVGDGLSSSKLVQEDVTRVTLVDAYFSRDSRLAVTAESQKFDHMSSEKRVYNLKFWKVLVSAGVKFELISNYPIAHVDRLVSIEEAGSGSALAQEEESSEDWPCFITTSCTREIKCWVYKSQVMEWVNSSIIHGGGELDIEVYSTCFSQVFSKLFLASSRGIIIYNWSRQHSILVESDIGYLSVKDSRITQMTTLKHMDEFYLLGFSSSPGKLLVWSITSMELVLEEDLPDLGSDFRLISLHSELSEKIPFHFALVKNKDVGKVSLYQLHKTKKSASKSGPRIRLKCSREIEIKLFEATSIKDALVQSKIESSKIRIYLVLLLSSYDIYIQEIETLERSDVISQVIQEIKVPQTDQGKEPLLVLERTKDGEEASKIVDIQTSIANMFLEATRDDVEAGKTEKKSGSDSALLNVSRTVQSILSHSKSSSSRPASSFSSLYCLKQSGTQVTTFLERRNFNNMSKNLSTCMCPAPSTLFWNLMSSHSPVSGGGDGRYHHDLRGNVHASSHVQVFGSGQAGDVSKDIYSDCNNSRPGQALVMSESLKPLQTQKLQSMLKKITFKGSK